MGIKHESGHEAVRFHADNVSGAQAVDGFLLRFCVSYLVLSWKPNHGAEPSVFNGFRARLDAGPERLRLGSAQAEFPLVLCAHESEQPGALVFELPVSASTIEKIEAFREGAGFEVAMQIACERTNNRPTVEHDDVLFRISQSQWLDVLQQANYGVHLLCEIPVEIGHDGEFAESWNAMHTARSLLHTGHYSNVVVECRKALETALKQLDRTDAVKASVKQYQGSGEVRRSMSKRDRIYYLVNAANQATHLGAHPDANNQAIDYSREEALMIFSTVASAIAFLARESTIG